MYTALEYVCGILYIHTTGIGNRKLSREFFRKQERNIDELRIVIRGAARSFDLLGSDYLQRNRVDFCSRSTDDFDAILSDWSRVGEDISKSCSRIEKEIDQKRGSEVLPDERYSFA